MLLMLCTAAPGDDADARFGHLGIGRGAGESLDGDVHGRRYLLGGVLLHLFASSCRMLRVKI
jgi:hypothetical protein